MKGCAFYQESIYLKPGEFFTGRSPARITTVLGSCVGITMFHRKNHVAAMCHAVLPTCRNKSSSCRMSCEEKFKFVKCAVAEMIGKMDELVISHDELEVKIFGGAALLPDSSGRKRGKSVGQQNIEAVSRMLGQYGLSVQAMEVGGDLGREVIFDTFSGEVLLRRIKPIHAQGVNVFPGAARLNNVSGKSMISPEVRKTQNILWQ